MFSERAVSAPVDRVRDRQVAEALVLDCDHDFQTLPVAEAEELGVVVDSLDPLSHSPSWLPSDAPSVLQNAVSQELAIGMPGDGSVTWNRQTDPPVVLCKPRLNETPQAFADFLVAEAFVQIGLEEAEDTLAFFGDEYPAFASAGGSFLGGVETYQAARACYEGYLGLQTRETFATWDGPLFEAWLDAGEQLDDRLSDLSAALASGRTSFSDGAELACSAIKHAGDIPPPFTALDAEVYLDHGPEYAVEWLDRTVTALD